MANLSVFITGSGKELINEFRKIGKEATISGSASSSAWGNAGKVMAGAGLAVAGAAIAVGAASIKAASNYDDAHQRLVTAIQDQKGNLKLLGPAIDAVDAKMASLGFKNADVEGSLSTLTVATKSGGKAIGLMGLAADIARGRHIDLASATSLLAKVETGHVALLGRYGLATKDVHGKTISSTQAVKELAGAYGGQAAAALKTLTGQHEAFSAQLNHVEIQVGKVLTPALSDLATFMTAKVIPAFQQTVAWVKQEWPKIVAYVTPAIDKIKGYITGFVNTVEHLWSQFGGRIMSYATETWDHLKTIFSGALEVIKGVFRLFADFLTGKWSKLWGDVQTIFSGAWKIIGALIGQAWDVVKAVVSLAWDGIKNAVKAGAGAVVHFMVGFPGMMLKALGDATQWLFNVGVDMIKGLLNGITSMAGGVLGAIKSVLPHSILGVHIPGLASGGPTIAGRPYVVGEKGPELFVPSSAGRIVPHNQAVGSGRPRGGGGDVHIHVYGDVNDANQFSQKVVNALQAHTRTNGAVAGVRTSG